MSTIEFSAERWEQIKRDSDLWWAGRLGRPLLAFTMPGRDPGRAEPEIPSKGFAAGYDFSISAEAIVDRWDYDLSCLKFMGDACPCIFPNFGAGVLAAFLGARVEARPETVWFHAPGECDIRDLHFEFDESNEWFQRIRAIFQAAVERWDGLVQMGMTDLGGTLDVLSTFLPGEQLLLDLYDHPDEVARLAGEIHDLWHRYYAELYRVLAPVNPGHTTWDMTFSTRPYYMLQCDFAYMIGPEMFDAFVRGELAASCDRLDRSMYHLDGVGQLPHLPSLLAIDALDGVQWIPGDGQPLGEHWMDVYADVLAADKKLWLTGAFGEIDLLDAIAARTGRLDQVFYINGRFNMDGNAAMALDEVQRFIDRFS